MRVLVAGGAGFVGRATVRALVEAGHSVRILSRDAWPSGSLFDRLGVEVVTGDAGVRATISSALQGMDALVQAAATYRYDRKAGPLMANNAPLARTILEAARDAKIGKVVDVSSLVVFALGHSPVNEDTPLTGPGRQRRRWFLSEAAMRVFARMNDLAGGRLSPLPDRGSIEWVLRNAPRVDTTHATRDLGLSFRPLRETLTDTIRWWAEHDSIDRRLAGRLAPKPV